jgi:acyl carrier protein
MPDPRTRLQEIFRDVLGDPDLVLSDRLSVGSHPEWDSVATVQIVLAAEAEFGVRLTTDEVASIRTAADILSALGKAGAR